MQQPRGTGYRAVHWLGWGIPILVLFGILGLTAAATGQSSDGPLEKIEREFQAILQDLKQAEKSDQRAKTLTRTLRRLETLAGRARAAYRDYPERHAERGRVEFHLRYMIKWTRYLIQRGGSNPEAPAVDSSRNEYRRGLELLAEAKRYENEHVEDRAGIVERYLKALPFVRSRKEEREILDRVNRIWQEVGENENVDGNRANPGPTGADASAPPARPAGKEPVVPKERNAPVAKERSPRTAEGLKQLRQDLLEGNKAQRLAAAEALATVTQRWVGRFLVQRLAEEGDTEVRKRLTEVVLRIGGRYVVLALGKWAKFKDPERRREAIRLLGRIGVKETEVALTGFVKDKDLDTIRHLIRVAKGLEKGYGVPTLARAAKQHPSLRFEVIEALGSTRHSDGAKVLISFLHRRKFPEFKDPAIKSLRMLGPNAIPPLIEALGGRDYRQWSAAALRSVTGQRFGMSPTRWRLWWRANRKRLLGDGR